MVHRYPETDLNGAYSAQPMWLPRDESPTFLFELRCVQQRNESSSPFQSPEKRQNNLLISELTTTERLITTKGNSLICTH